MSQPRFGEIKRWPMEFLTTNSHPKFQIWIMEIEDASSPYEGWEARGDVW